MGVHAPQSGSRQRCFLAVVDQTHSDAADLRIQAQQLRRVAERRCV